MVSPEDGPGSPSSSPSIPAATNNHEEQSSTSAISQDQGLQTVIQTSPGKRHAETAPDDGSPPSTKKTKKSKKNATNKVLLHELNEDVHLKKITYNNKTCLPNSIVVHRVNPLKTAPVWDFFRVLETVIFEQVKPVKKVLSVKPLSFLRLKEFTHLCMECIGDVKAMDDRANQNSWNRGLCKILNTSNADNHLSKKHSESAKVQAYFDQKKAGQDSVGSLHSGFVETGLNIVDSFKKTQRELIREKQIRWLSLNGLPHHITQSPEFAEMFHVYDPTFKPVARATYLKGLLKIFLSMVSGITKLTDSCRCDMGELGNWLSVVHDIWTSITKNGILGSSIKITTSDMETYTIATVLKKNNVTHSAGPVADQLQQTYQDRYNIDLRKEAAHVTSDTTASAHNVGACLDAYQNDCDMHVVSLVLLYSLGWNENTRTHTDTDEVCCFP